MIPGDEGQFHYSYRTARAGTYFVSVLYDGAFTNQSVIPPTPLFSSSIRSSDVSHEIVLSSKILTVSDDEMPASMILFFLDKHVLLKVEGHVLHTWGELE